MVKVRFFTAMLLCALLSDILDPILYLGIPDSLVAHAANRTLGAHAFMRMFCVLALLLMPMLGVQFMRRPRHQRGFTQLACLGLALSGVVWFLLAYSVDHASTTSLTFLRSGTASILLALALAYSINCEQRRKEKR